MLLPLGIVWLIHPGSAFSKLIVVIIAALLAPLPALLYSRRQRATLLARAAIAEEEAAKLKLQLDTVRFRTSRLREELQAADRQARLSHQLTLLGQFTAGFMHEFNNPLAIVVGDRSQPHLPQLRILAERLLLSVTRAETHLPCCAQRDGCIFLVAEKSFSLLPWHDLLCRRCWSTLMRWSVDFMPRTSLNAYSSPPTISTFSMPLDLSKHIQFCRYQRGM